MIENRLRCLLLPIFLTFSILECEVNFQTGSKNQLCRQFVLTLVSMIFYVLPALMHSGGL